ncbi:MAG: hypothetical protein DRP34_00515 [Thermodesulfobacteriota bacterium]|nr:MAG: hypothetical protein DRP34_00515 [Thermodesulfobacteriota bacterium]
MQDKNIKDLIIIKRNLEKSLLVKQARKSFKTFCEYVFGLKPGKIHLEWHNLATKAMMEGEPCIIFAPRSHAKCHTPNTIITLADGSLKEAKDCKVGDEVISYDVENFRFVPAKIVNIIDNGIKDICEVKLASGKSIEVTSNHPFLTTDGWKSIEEGLKVENYVGTYEKGSFKIDIIRSIEYKGKKPTIGLEIEKYHNHITNGIITHNTSYMAVMRPIFLLGHNPNLRIKIVSHSDKKAADILRQIKEAIESNERLKEVFPHLEAGDVWASNKILVKRSLWSKDVTIEALGILSGATGGRADYIVFDDVVEFNNTIKHPALIKMVKEAFYNNWLNLLEPDGYGWCLIGTIWTQMDLHWEFHQKPLKYKKIYRINLETLEPIWKEHWSKEKLIERYNSMPLRAFARAFALLPISREDAVFNRENIEACIVYNDPKYYREKCDYVIIGVDLAISQKKTAANTAIFVMGVIKEKNKLVALHAEYGKWTSPETVNAITKNFEDWKADIIVVENNQYQEALIQWLNEFNRELPVQAHFTTSAKHDPEIGLPSMALEFERKKWIIPMGKLPHDVDCKCGKCKWIEELTMYPFGETSDIVMASYFAREYWRKHIVSKEDVKVDTL